MENYYKTRFWPNQTATVLRGIGQVVENSDLVDKVLTYDRKMGGVRGDKMSSWTTRNVSDVDRFSNSGEGAQHLRFYSGVKERTEDISEGMSKSLMHENEMLKHKVLKIEIENRAQQRHLRQLEKIVMGLTCNRSSGHLDIEQQYPCNESIFRNSPVEITQDVKVGDSPLRKGWEDMEEDCRNEVDEELSRDVASLMDEFDRNARENGLMYSMTPCHSIADSEDVAEDKELQEEILSSPVESDTQSENVSAYPLPAFLTPSYHGVDSPINPHSNSNGPLVSPQLCLTTPILLTTEALREAEDHQGLDQQYLGPKNKVQEKITPYFLGFGDGSHPELPATLSVQDNLKKSSFAFSLGNKSSPFSNLLAGLHQKSHSCLRQSKSLSKGRWSVRGDKSGNQHHEFASDDLQASHLPGFRSPGSSVGSVCGQVCKWSRTLKHPLLSPLSGSHCSDLETHTSDEDFLTELMFSVAENADAEASDEEDLVVDEVVSLSVAGGSRHRCESFCSIAGPCVPPDLLLDTRKCAGEVGVEVSECQVKEEDILTEIAGELEDSVVLEDTKNVTSFLREADHVEVKPECLVREKQVECHLKEEPEAGLESSRCVLELIGSKPQVIDDKAQQGNSSYLDRKDVKLPAGSIILAMVNESGSLVPLPQLQVAPQSLSNSVKHNFDEKILDEEIDVETVLEKTPVLEAGDLDSLLAQFEASEAVNKNGIGSPEHENKSKISGQSKLMGPVSPVASGRRLSVPGSVLSSQTSPTHQNIKDALPKEIIEKIKASTKRKSTQMLSEPVVVRKGRGVRQQEAAAHRSKVHRVVSRTAVEQTSGEPQQTPTDHRVPPPLDHDYCFSPDKPKKNKHVEMYTTTGDGMFTKLPDYYTTIPRREVKKPSISDDSHDDGGKKDSGVESGDVSDASIETEERRKDGKDSRCSQKDWASTDNKEDGTGDKNENIDVYNKLPAYMTDIGNSMPKEDGDIEGSGDGDKEEIVVTEKPQMKKIKRKLNLSEYRQRIQSAQSSRCPSPALTSSTNASPSSTPLQVSESVEKLERTNSENDVNAPMERSENGLVNPVEEDMEEGELKGDSDPETPDLLESGSLTRENYTGRLASVTVDSQKENGVKTSEKPVPGIAATLFSSSDFANCNGLWKNCSRTSSMRRWSSSSRSRSRSRSPPNKKQHTSRKHRSSRGKRKRTHTPSHSSQSPHSSSRRCWSRSHSRSKSRGRSSSSCSLSCSSSRSRSRSHSNKTRDRWGYSRRFSSRERRRRSRSRSRRSHSRSRSQSSSRYSRVTRSRSPIWGTVRRSRSPSHRFSVRPRRPEDEDRTRQVEERRVIYIGRISEGTSKGELRHRFQKFGDIVDISVHFREHGDNYGFVTFKNRDEAYNAVEHGNEDPSLPHYDLCFGGRRAFCRVQYSDLDAQADSQFGGGGPVGGPVNRISPANMDFDSLLRAAMKKKTR